MTDRYVPSGGSPSYATIQAALNACSAGDRVLIASGTYTEKDITWPAGGPANVTITAQTGATVILAPATATTAIIKVEIAGGGAPVSGATIQDIELKAPAGKYCIAGSNSANLTLRRVSVQPPHLGSFLTTGGTGTLIEDCQVMCGVHGIRRSGGSALTVRNSIIRSGNPGSGRIVCETYDATDSFQNSLFVLCTGVTGYALRLDHGATAKNCAASKEGTTGGDGFYINHASADVDYCLAYGFTNNFNEVLASMGANCLEVAPQFADAASRDYHSAAGSPLIDAGTTIAAVTDDLDGVARPEGSAYDIGPYEYEFPRVSAAASDGYLAVRVTLDRAIAGYGLDDPGLWTVTAPLGGAAVGVDSATVADTDEILLILDSPMDPDTIYRVTADPPVSPSYNTADFLTPPAYVTSSTGPILVASDGAIHTVVPGEYDLLAVDSTDLSTQLRDAVILSLLSDRRADPDDQGLDPRQPLGYLRGWWADDLTGDSFGSRLWLLERETVTDATLLRAEEYAREALDWLVTDGVAARVEVSAAAQGNNAILLTVSVYRRAGEAPVIVAFDPLWEGVA